MCPDETTLSDFLAGMLPEQERARVLAHLESCEACQQQVALGVSSSHGEAPRAPSTAAEADAPLAPGARLARYVVVERIGRGAMGEVYAAYDPELARQVALKLLRPEGRHVEALRVRLLREAQALARLSHPHVVTVHDTGVCDQGVFLSLELVEGSTLADWLKSPRAPAEVLRVFVDAGRGLAAAHAAGLVHRDFKPDNVLVGRDGRVRVTDFGLARSSVREEPQPAPVPAGEEPVSTLTRSGALLGTPAYMAPEQLDGHGADALSDQFSFCVALHEALHGQRPFAGRNIQELGQAMREEQVRAPGGDSRVSARVRRAVRRGLRAAPGERHPSMEALLAELSPAPRRVRSWVAASAVAASLLGVALGYVAAHRRAVRCEQETEKLAAAWSPERRERVRTAFLATGKPYASAAWEATSRALDDHATRWSTLRTASCMAAEREEAPTSWLTTACLDTRLWHFAAVTGVLEQADAQTVQNASQVVASLEGLEGCTEAPVLATQPQPPDALRPRVDDVRRRLAEAHALLDAGNQAAALERTTALLPEVTGIDYRPLEAEVLTLHGQLHGLTGRPKEAEDILYRAMWAAEAGRDDVTVARAWILLLWVVGEQMARVDEVNRLVQHARAAMDRLGRERFPLLATELHLRMGGQLLVQGKLDEADAEYSQGLELSRRAYGADSLRTSYFLSGLGRVRSRQIRGPEALALYRQVVEIRERLSGPDHPSLALTLNNIASELLQQGRPDEALTNFRRALSLLESARSPDHPSLGAPLNNLAVLLRREGRLDESRRTFERALAIFERSKGPDHPNTVTALGGLGMVAYDAQNLDEALALAQKALTRIQRGMGPDTPRAELPLRTLGAIHLRAGRPSLAREQLQRALRLLQKENGADNAVTAGATRELGIVELRSGTPQAALLGCQRALVLDERSQGPESPDVALDLACLGEAQLALEGPTRARPLLERARHIHERAPGDPLDAAWVSFLLARALTEHGPASEAARAASLLEEARGQMEALGVRARVEHQTLLDWRARQ